MGMGRSGQVKMGFLVHYVEVPAVPNILFQKTESIREFEKEYFCTYFEIRISRF
jgi:hypothetical protein